MEKVDTTILTIFIIFFVLIKKINIYGTNNDNIYIIICFGLAKYSRLLSFGSLKKWVFILFFSSSFWKN